jgi:7-cyano-7-deazaguanine reductase
VAAHTLNYACFGSLLPPKPPEIIARMVKIHTGVSLLGSKAQVPSTPDEATLDRVPNPHAGENYIARFTVPEFTSLCPITGQPDFAHLVIDYLPSIWLIESKSLKLYLTSFRNHGAFHEDCTLRIGRDLKECLEPRWLRIGGYWYPRGGIPIDVFWATGELPAGTWVPEQGVPPYRGRG